MEPGEFAHKKVLILLTGGTIAGNVAKTKTSIETNTNPESFLNIVNNSISSIKKTWNIEIKPDIIELFNLDSSNILPENWKILTETIRDQYNNYDSFIILHGTNTMGYTCSALSFALENIAKPVIVTGAQVPLGYLGSDATTNLINSLRFSVWKYNSIMGVLSVFGSKIISGVRVKKGTDFDYDPFQSFITGGIGRIGRFIKIDLDALNKHNSYLSKSKPLAKDQQSLSIINNFDTQSIASLTEFPGMSLNLFKSLVKNNNIKAFVLRSFGAGDVSSHMIPALEYLKLNKIPIIVTTQAPNGNANFQVNEAGQYIAQHDLAIPAYDMSIESMTTKMAWLLAQNKTYDEIKTTMIQSLHGEINVEEELR